jgi:hypothetical protein
MVAVEIGGLCSLRRRLWVGVVTGIVVLRGIEDSRFEDFVTTLLLESETALADWLIFRAADVGLLARSTSVPRFRRLSSLTVLLIDMHGVSNNQRLL